jgi:hypothetical protein
MTRRS